MRLQAEGLGKSYGPRRVLEDVSFEVLPGRITGMLGPNGAGKSTALRLMLNLCRGEGRTTYGGRLLVQHEGPRPAVGAHLDPRACHPGRSARAHLMMLAAAAGVPTSRVDEVVRRVGLEEVQHDRPKGFSLGMCQRLGLAGALLGRPHVLVLDEPVNGLDAQAIRWLRHVLRAYADEGNAILVSSHLLSEMQILADRVVLLAQGRLVVDEEVAVLLERQASLEVAVSTSDDGRLIAALRSGGAAWSQEDGVVVVHGQEPAAVGALARQLDLEVWGLTRRTPSLERVFFELTEGAQDFRLGEVPAL